MLRALNPKPYVYVTCMFLRTNSNLGGVRQPPHALLVVTRCRSARKPQHGTVQVLRLLLVLFFCFCYRSSLFFFVAAAAGVVVTPAGALVAIRCQQLRSKLLVLVVLVLLLLVPGGRIRV